ncbi:MAG TPA: hypothetical protein DGD08_12540 [Gemmatimonas aurantiaca]|uniref:Uncharacterized protein n=2 Tax=Gemmatimonas aurantiaca TaxID=173480 RepID=C1ABU0_GEMAT|nr:hypothetical protein [Gemmatimonas aurantiaca]BAH39967.1 hypothetical protein GAU_2925 [Gemmatimonas aurantiaca T-27]HCT58024.1 hypothetical protein [Gemmatimonas aurantiaca]
MMLKLVLPTPLMVRCLALLVGCLMAVPVVLGAQSQPRRPAAVVQISVIDSALRPVESAEVLVRQGLRTLGVTRVNAAGAATLSIVDDSSMFEVVARQLGFGPARRFVRLVFGDTISLILTLTPSPQQLAAVQVTARESLRQRAYHLDGETIAASTLPIRSALDVMLRLRPYMLTSLSGGTVCGTVQEVWVNGTRVPKDLMPDPRQVGRKVLGRSVSPAVLTILESIKPEHIAEMSYIDCFGGTVQKVGSEDAVYIVLKPDIEYRWPDGTFHVSDTARAGRM